MDRIPMTKTGLENLRKELEHLKKNERHQVKEEIAVARAHGDLKENAEYHAAREKQSFIEGRIAELEDKVLRAEVIDPSTLASDKVLFGSQVTLLNLETDSEVVYTVVGDDEADYKSNLIAVSSPLAQSLIGKRVGDEVVVNAPKGAVEYEILKIGQ
ncbi:transcription elongation factor GreA [Desulfurispirillum indicum S5]|uniref:Transcription elongation factor GreA n=1 Tax=Desulfurispirillum indicum (strain ATCC BAA-1389 / DSM 22839 / S5) TaxID=653733 RepID=E6W255_DESIS|nr:transcription elongation factor GreA [Desulfurispirillum indicum]ADU65513.1 transcription elongation factor GreA [Desulfurispirillum indicum S5]